MKKGITRTAPRISDSAAQFYPAIFPSLNAGLEFVADAFPVLYRRTLHGLKGRLERSELSLMIDIFNSTALRPGILGQHLAAQVSDGIALDHLDEKWEIDGKKLNEKIGKLTMFECACLELWANGFWYRECDGELGRKEFDEWIGQVL